MTSVLGERLSISGMQARLTQIASEMDSSPEFKNTAIPKIILGATIIAGTPLILLSSESSSSNPVPKVIFGGPVSIFHAFVISIIFAFTGSFCALMIPNKVKTARFFRSCSMISMASALLLLAYALLIASFWWVSQGKQFMAERASSA